MLFHPKSIFKRIRNSPTSLRHKDILKWKLCNLFQHHANFEWTRIPLCIISFSKVLIRINKVMVPLTKVVISFEKFEWILKIRRRFNGSFPTLTMMFQTGYQAISIQIHCKPFKFIHRYFFGTPKGKGLICSSYLLKLRFLWGNLKGFKKFGCVSSEASLP
jgi:hypothetical protein